MDGAISHRIYSAEALFLGHQSLSSRHSSIYACRFFSGGGGGVQTADQRVSTARRTRPGRPRDRDDVGLCVLYLIYRGLRSHHTGPGRIVISGAEGGPLFGKDCLGPGHDLRIAGALVSSLSAADSLFGHCQHRGDQSGGRRCGVGRGVNGTDVLGGDRSGHSSGRAHLLGGDSGWTETESRCRAVQCGRGPSRVVGGQVGTIASSRGAGQHFFWLRYDHRSSGVDRGLRVCD